MSEEWKVMPPPAPVADREALMWAKTLGQIAGFGGVPPTCPTEFAIYAQAWSEGWREGAEGRRRFSAWISVRPDHGWKEE